MTHYEVLGVAVTASPSELRRAYVRLARQHHPDFHTRTGGKADAERRMQRINEAWSVLGDPHRRRVYDRTLASTPPPAGAGPSAGPPAPDIDEEDDWDRDRDLDLYDDEPLTDAQVKGSWTLLPVALFFTSIGLFCLSMILQAAPVLSLSVVLFLVSVASFLLLPFLAMAGSRRRDLSDGGEP